MFQSVVHFEFQSKGNRLSLQQLLVPHQDQQHKEKVERDCFLRKGPKYTNMSIMHGNDNGMTWLRDDTAMDLTTMLRKSPPSIDKIAKITSTNDIK